MPFTECAISPRRGGECQQISHSYRRPGHTHTHPIAPDTCAAPYSSLDPVMAGAYEEVT